MLVFKNLEGMTITTISSKDILTLEDLRKVGSQFNRPSDARFFFKDMESDVFEIIDNEDFEYAISQAKSELTIVMVPNDFSVQTTTISEIELLISNSDLNYANSLNDLKIQEEQEILPIVYEVKKQDNICEKKEKNQTEKSTKNNHTEILKKKQQEITKGEKIIVVSPKNLGRTTNENSKTIDEISSTFQDLAGSLKTNLNEIGDSFKNVSRPKMPEKCTSRFIFKSLMECDACMRPIIGKRFKCMQCRHFDLCEKCEKKLRHPHTMIRLGENTDEKHVDQIVRIYSLKKKLGEMNERETRKTLLKKATNSSYPEEFYEQFLGKNEGLGFGEFMNKVLTIFE